MGENKINKPIRRQQIERELMEEYRKYEPVFGSYYLKRPLGKGSFGRVFEIVREDEGGDVFKSALKIISVPQDDEEIRIKLAEGEDVDALSAYYHNVLLEIKKEIRIMDKLKGKSNIVSYEDHTEFRHSDGIGYDILIRMELLTPLTKRKKEDPLREDEVVKLGIDICNALEDCHKRNIIHRDVKPQNIFITEDGDFKLGDFGVAKNLEFSDGEMTKTGANNYMAPEVFRGECYDTSVDIYSLGIVLYSLMNDDNAPFISNTSGPYEYAASEALTKRLRGEAFPAPCNADSRLAAIITKACAFSPHDRFESAGQMRSALKEYYDSYEQGSKNKIYGANDATVIERNGIEKVKEIPEGIRSGRNENSGNRVKRDKPPTGRSGNDPNGGKGRGRGKSVIIAGTLAAVLLMCVAAIYLAVGTRDEEPSVDTSEVKVLSSDWDWDSHRITEGSIAVDTIMLVQNNSDQAITGISYEVDALDGNQIENGEKSGDPFTAYGYIKAGKMGIMVGEAHPERNNIKPDDNTYVVKDVYLNSDIEDYSMPTGYVTRAYGKNNDNYDISVNNPNDEAINANAIVAMAKVDGNRIVSGSADATGKLTDPIPPNTSEYIQEKAFFDPGLFDVDYEDVTVYVIDKDYYDLDD